MSQYRDARLKATTIRTYMVDVPESGISGTHASESRRTKEKHLTKCEVEDCDFLFIKKGMRKYCPTHADIVMSKGRSNYAKSYR